MAYAYAYSKENENNSIALKHEGWVQYMPCIPSTRVITSLYPEGIAT